jgi:N-acetylmuramoyl-L-alanine amidase
VAIDAGHGGYTPGATYGSIEEKDLNLDIAQRLDKYLEAKRIKTYMLREDDSYLNNYERAYIANALGASLFISVHNNALDDPGYGGTMTLYYPGGAAKLSGKTFAQYVQNKLLYRLKTKDRKVIDRPNLIVLKATKMPSIIAEIAYMTNKTDRNNLLNSGFRGKAALALSEGVIQALDKLK